MKGKNFKEWCIEERKENILKEWDYKKNTFSPENYTKSSKKKVWWKCNRGHEWEAYIYNRVFENSGCPYCAGKKVLPGENDLETFCLKNNKQQLLDEWNYKKNKMRPSEYVSGSQKKVWWKCDNDHEWEATIHNRIKEKSGCPYCAGKKVSQGKNDLETYCIKYNRQDLLQEWDYSMNNLCPNNYTKASKKVVNWKCEKGHSWSASISNRYLHKSGCPYCKKILQTSFPEQAVFYYVKQYFPDAKNRCKEQGFEIDIFIPSINVGIEYDGKRWHKNIYNKDILKGEKCKQSGILLVRIRETGLPEIDNCLSIKRKGWNNKSLENCIKELFAVLKIPDAKINIDADENEIKQSLKS